MREDAIETIFVGLPDLSDFAADITYCAEFIADPVGALTWSLGLFMTRRTSVWDDVLIDQLCYTGQKQLIDVDIAWEIAQRLQDTSDSAYFGL
jgi:hypothetical protein